VALLAAGRHGKLIGALAIFEKTEEMSMDADDDHS
jgi:hypothetical protein